MVRMKKCKQCGGKFDPVRWWQEFCKPLCRMRAFRKRRKVSK